VWLTPHLRDPQPEGERELYFWQIYIGSGEVRGSNKLHTHLQGGSIGGYTIDVPVCHPVWLNQPTRPPHTH